MPTYVQLERPAGRREEGAKLNEGYHVGRFTAEEAKEFAAMMGEEFMKHWEKFQKVGFDAAKS